jgi:Cu-Zn family superoxide dismutase
MKAPSFGFLFLVSAVLFPVPVFANAKAVFVNAEGKATGTAILTENDKGVQISLDVEGLAPGLHAIHIHGAGKCEGPDFASAGPHFNPHNKKHGIQNPDGAHAGDLPNLTVGEDGIVQTTLTASQVNLKEGDAHSLFQENGTSLVIHAGPDDDVTDPSGNSGGRVACAIIKKIE